MSGPMDPLRLFSDYLRVTGVAHLGPEPAGDPALLGKRVGLLNGAAWIGLWTSYFGRLYLPGAHLVSIGNEAVQLSFMEAHQRGLPCPPASNIAAFSPRASPDRWGASSSISRPAPISAPTGAVWNGPSTATRRAPARPNIRA